MMYVEAPPAGSHDSLPSPREYTISLPVFEGPLDLLLHLIEREELDITAISLVQITDQYLQYIEQMERVNADYLADFLVIAAQLIWIKSRALLPKPPAPPEEEEEDPGEQLARQLREYKRFKEVARQLGEREQKGLRSYVRVASIPKSQGSIDLGGITLADLVAAVRQALAVAPPAPPVDHVVRPFTVTVAQRARHILERARAGQPFTFRSLLNEAASRVEIVVTLLAVLELLKRQAIRVYQEELFGEIIIEAAGPLPEDSLEGFQSEMDGSAE